MFVRGLTRVVDDVLHDSADVAMAFGVIEVAELGRGLVQARVGRCFSKWLEISRRILPKPKYLSEGSYSLKMEPRPFLWLRITLPMMTRRRWLRCFG